MSPSGSSSRPRGAIPSERQALLAARVALDKQADRVIVLDVRGLSNVTDFFVVATLGNVRQLDAVREEIERVFAGQGWRIWHTEGEAHPPAAGSEALNWVLLDCGGVVVHLFDSAAHDFYRLEDLWADAPHLPVPFDPAAPGTRQTPA